MPRIYSTPARRSPSLFRRLFALVRLCVWVGVLGGAGYFLFFSGRFALQTVSVEGSVLTDPETVKAAVQPGSNLLFLNKQAVSSKVLRDPIITSVRVLRGLPDEVRLVVQERESALVWETGTSLVVLDTDGVAIAQFTKENFPLPGTSAGDVLGVLPKVTDSKALPVTVGRPVVSPVFIRFIQQSQQALGEYLPELTVERYEVIDSTYDVTLIAGQGMRVQLNTLTEAPVQIRNLTRLVRQEKATFSSQVDLRIGRWAYVR
jgi:cell division septal protein FtsQ